MWAFVAIKGPSPSNKATAGGWGGLIGQSMDGEVMSFQELEASSSSSQQKQEQQQEQRKVEALNQTMSTEHAVILPRISQ